MGLRQWASKQLQRVSNSLYSEVLESTNPNLWGGGIDFPTTRSGESVGPVSSMRAPTFYACVDLLSRVIAQLPLRVYTREADGDIFPDEASPLHRVLAVKPNAWQTPFDYWLGNITDICTRGWFISWKNMGGGRVQALIPLDPGSVQIDQAMDGSLLFSGGSWGLNKTFNFKREPQRNFFFCHYRTKKDGVTPASPISHYAETIGMELSAIHHGATLLKNDATPPLVVVFPDKRSPEAIKAFGEQWSENGTGGNYGRPKILDGGPKVDRLSMSNEDAQLLQTREFGALSICGLFGIPPRLVGIERNAKGWATVEQQAIEFLSYGLNPWLSRCQNAVSRDLIPVEMAGRVFAKFDTEQLLGADRKTLAEFLGFAIDKRVMSRNEARLKLNMNRVEGGDAFDAPKPAVPAQTPNANQQEGAAQDE